MCVMPAGLLAAESGVDGMPAMLTWYILCHDGFFSMPAVRSGHVPERVSGPVLLPMPDGHVSEPERAVGMHTMRVRVLSRRTGPAGMQAMRGRFLQQRERHDAMHGMPAGLRSVDSGFYDMRGVRSRYESPFDGPVHMRAMRTWYIPERLVFILLLLMPIGYGTELGRQVDV